MLDDVLQDLQSSIHKAHESLRTQLGRLRTGRATASMLDSVRVDYYGTPTPISQMANVQVPEPRLITVKAWEKNQGKAIDKAIRESGLGLNPQLDGDLVRIPIPALTEERRKDLAKQARKVGEECKIAVREARRNAKELVDTLVKDGDVGEDEGELAWKKAEELVVHGNKQVDEIVAGKEKDIMTV
ncbi:MAG: ribosome recycling factor [Deltaproteobacteria bacterium]|nr:ribosome recycling factor [Deltaproteobacteria bacterium]